MSSSGLSIGPVGFSFGNRKIVDLQEISLPLGRVSVVMGPSGSGKSTLFRILAGLLSVSGGNRETSKRLVERVIVSFQDIDAFPWMTVGENLRLMAKLGSKPESLVSIMAKRIGLESHQSFYPMQLSGGMRKRLALGRVLLSGRDVVLLDEPFSSLDLKNKVSMWDMVAELARIDGVTFLITTHDIDEALAISSNIIWCQGPPLRMLCQIEVEQSDQGRELARSKIISLARS